LGIIEKRLVGSMQLTVQPVLHKQLMAYSRTMGVWAKNVMRTIQFAVNSFADVYRASIQEMARSTESTEDAAQIREDIASLRL
jgi:hypothetical protein